MRANFIALDSRVDCGASISWKLLNAFRLLILVCTTALVSGCLTGLPIEWYCIPNAIPECSAIQKCPTRAQTSVHSQQAYSGNCALAPIKCMRRTFTQLKLFTPPEYRSTVGSLKNQFHQDRTGRNNQRLKHDATLISNAAPLAN